MLKRIPLNMTIRDSIDEGLRRGALRRQDKRMTPEEAEAVLAGAFCGRTGTVGPDGYPYVVPNLFVWLDQQIYLHTARYSGHFLTNARHCDRVCFEVDEPGEVYPYGRFECDTSVSFRSVVVFGRIREIADEDDVIRFYRALLAKYAPHGSWEREIGPLPRTGRTIVYAITPETITGKQGPLPVPAERWPAVDKTASPRWKPIR
jgi:nitroimidazol reductase NimA-like FMN-containing flavoprotein (pyridoxamine 5'-phosphate oxidase superfamily)